MAAAVLQIPASAQTTLYNGITLPSVWPPLQTATQQYQLPTYITSPPKTIPINLGRQLFVDDFLIFQTSLTRTQHRPTMYTGNPILTPGSPNGTDMNNLAMVYSDGVWFDPKDKVFKMWYDGGYGNMIAYATSTDGINWTKPSLAAAKLPGTNMVLQIGGERDSAITWMDLEETDPNKRFKEFAYYPVTSVPQLLYFTSPDGISWTPQPNYIQSLSDRSTMFWNPFRKVWVDSMRSLVTFPATSSRSSFYGRGRYYAESPDLTSWTPSNWTGSFWTGPDSNDPPYPGYSAPAELYNLDAVAYESVMVGLFSWFYPDHSLVELGAGFSRDGFQWVRPTRGAGTSNAFIPASNQAGTWNAYNTQSAGGGFLVVGDKLYFYFSGRNYPHGGAGQNYTGLATLRRDGFYSVDAAATEGTLLTRPVTFSGGHFFVNVADAQGTLYVEAVDAATGQVIAPFSKSNCNVVSVDKTLQEVTWNNASDLSSLVGRNVQFRFYLTKGSLYSFWVTDSSGASHGYMAAGGPNFTGPTDTIGSGAAPVPPPPTPTPTPTPLIASVVSPIANQQVSGMLPVQAATSGGATVTQLQIRADGSNIGTPCSTGSCTVAWNTSGIANGSHMLDAIATDSTGATAQSVTVPITVNNVTVVPPPPPPSTTGPVAYWTFDSATVSGTKVSDSSGDGVTGTLQGGASIVTGEVNQALSLDGHSGWMNVPAETFTDLTGDLSLALWIKTANATRSEALLARYSAAAAEYGYIFRTNSSGHLEFRIGGHNLAAASPKTIADTGRAINDGQWHHVAVVVGLKTGLSFYIDGVLSSTQNFTILASPSQSNLHVGVNAWLDYGNYFTGTMDEARVYNRQLSAAEVAALAGSSSAPPPIPTPPTPTPTPTPAPSGATATWTFDANEISANLALDSSGNQINGTLRGGFSLVTGKVNQALNLDGVSGYMSVPYETHTEINGSFTLAAWIKTANSRRLEAIFSRYNAAGSEAGYILRSDAAGHLELRIGGKNMKSGAPTTFTDIKVVNDGQWHHVAAVVTSGQGVSFYVDGVLTSTLAGSVQPAAAQANLQLGVNPWLDYGNYFTGTIDEVNFYARAFAATEVAALASGN